MSEVIFICRECGSRINAMPGEDGSGTWACENGHQCGVWLNQGTLDLGLVEPDAECKSDFTIFTDLN